MSVFKGKEREILQDILTHTIENHEGCWLWTKSCFKQGYGQKKISQVNWKVHRIMYTIYNGEIPDGVLIRHRCGNRRCCNPLHLAEGTLEDNALDSKIHGTSRLHNIDQTGMNNHMAKLDEESIYEMRRLYAQGNMTFEELGQMFGCSRKPAERAIRGTTYLSFDKVPCIPSTRKREK